jgi:hypothetical protein
MDQVYLQYAVECVVSVEEKVLELQQTKRDLAAAIIGADNSLIRDLRREDPGTFVVMKWFRCTHVLQRFYIEHKPGFRACVRTSICNSFVAVGKSRSLRAGRCPIQSHREAMH